MNALLLLQYFIRTIIALLCVENDRIVTGVILCYISMNSHGHDPSDNIADILLLLGW